MDFRLFWNYFMDFTYLSRTYCWAVVIFSKYVSFITKFRLYYMVCYYLKNLCANAQMDGQELNLTRAREQDHRDRCS
jgi:hypothetical protein